MRPTDNPFAVQRLGRLTPRLPAGSSWEGVLANLERLRFRAALVGPEGHGKSTLLGELGRRLAAAGWRIRRHQLHFGERRLPPTVRVALLADLTATDLILLDGAEQLSWLAWRNLDRATRRAGGLIVTSHRTGLLPTLLDCPSAPELLDALINELVSDQPAAALPHLPSAAELWARHAGNQRDALLELYDLCARHPS